MAIPPSASHRKPRGALRGCRKGRVNPALCRFISLSPAPLTPAADLMRLILRGRCQSLRRVLGELRSTCLGSSGHSHVLQVHTASRSSRWDPIFTPLTFSTQGGRALSCTPAPSPPRNSHRVCPGISLESLGALLMSNPSFSAGGKRKAGEQGRQKTYKTPLTAWKTSNQG